MGIRSYRFTVNEFTSSQVSSLPYPKLCVLVHTRVPLPPHPVHTSAVMQQFLIAPAHPLRLISLGD